MYKPIKKIMLIFPPVTRPADFSAKVVRVSIFFPLGLAYLAASLEKTGRYEIEVLDALLEGDAEAGHAISGGRIRYGLTDEEISARINNFKPDVVGVSCLFSAMQSDVGNVCRIAKEANTDIITVAGGAHVSAVPAEMLAKHPQLDFIVIGEGEVSFTRLIGSLEEGSGFSELDGFAYRQNGNIKLVPKSTYIENLDTLPFPERGLFDMNKYFKCASAHSTYRSLPFTQMITSRGCPFKCAFCALENHWGNRQRMRSAENVLDELDLLVSRYGVKEVHFEDDNLTADRKRAIEIFDGIIRRGLDITWNVPSGMAVSSLDEELLAKMKASGCYSVSLAIESGNQDILSKLMNKPVNLKKVPELVKRIRKTGMDARGFFIIGYPGETKATIKQTIDYARSLELDWAYFFIASPIPGTRMFKECVDKGYMKDSDFDPVRSFHRSVINTPEFTPEYLAEVREEAIVDVNFKNNPNLRNYDIDKAIANFAEVVDRYPHFDFANFYLGEAYLKKGERAKARSSYQMAVAANPAHREANARLKELGEGR